MSKLEWVRGVAVVFAVSVGSGAAAQETATMASKFLDLCVSPSSEARETCGSFIVGMIDVYALLAAKNPNDRTVCPTRTLSPTRGRQLFVEWAGRHSNELSMPFWEAVETAIRERYPCAAPLIRLPER